MEYLEGGQQTEGTISIGGEDVKKVTTFKYLGSTLSSDSDILPDVCMRVNAAWAKLRQVTRVLCNRRMPDHLKVKIFKTIILPVALYRFKCWRTTKKHEQALSTKEMCMLHWSLSLTRWAHAMNTDVRK